MSQTIGVSSIGTESIAGEWARAAPSLTITVPSSTVTATTTTLSFTYSSPVSATQYSYQAQVRSQDGSTILFDTGTVVSSSSSGLTIDFLLSGGSTYQIWARATDVNGDTSAWATKTFIAEVGDVSSYPDNTQVGSVYEIAINGTGYMLADTPEVPVRRQVQQLNPPRFATGDTPFSEAVERYTFVGQSDFTGGAGQERLDRPDSDSTRYWDSEGINPFDDEALQLTNAAEAGYTTTHADCFLATIGNGSMGGHLFMVTDDGELTPVSDGVSATPFTITGAGAVTDFVSSGLHWYYADGSNIYRNTTDSDPGSAWSTIDADVLGWIDDRVAAAYYDGSNNLCITTLDEAGTEEVAGGRFKFTGTASSLASCSDIIGGDGYMWFSVERGAKSTIHYWQIGSSDTYAATALTLPAGQTVIAMGFYLGNVFLKVDEYRPGGGGSVIIYRCIPQDGKLTPQRVMKYPAFQRSKGGFVGLDRFVFFDWPNMTDGDEYSGIGCFDLETGGYCKWMWSDVTDKFVAGVAEYNGDIWFSISTDGVWTDSGAPNTSGWLTTSISDQASTIPKIVDETQVTMDVLPANSSVSLEYTTDNGNSYTSAGDAADDAGLTINTWDVDQRVQLFGLKLTLATTGTSPKIRHVQTQLHPQTISDQVIVFPINCGDQVAGMNNATIPYTQTGVQRFKTLESMIGSRIRLQDVDWPTTQVATIWEIVAVEGDLHGVFDQHVNRRSTTGRALVTLRRESS